MPYDRTSYFENRRAGRGGGGGGETYLQNAVLFGGNYISPEVYASIRHTENQLEATKIQAGAYRYGADKRLEEAAVPRISETTSYDLSPKEAPSWNPTPILARARGGPVSRRPYLVGEKGPELMVPDQNGTIVPNHKLQALVRNAIPRADGGRVFREPPPGTVWAGRQSLANAGQADRTAAETRKHEAEQRAKYFEPTVPKLAAEAAANTASEAAFRAQANAMFTVPGPDGKPQVDPRAAGLINLYAKLPVTPEYALGAVQHGMEIHKLADSWKDGTKLAELGKIANIPPAEAEKLKAGDPAAVLKAENWLGNNHGYDPGVLTGARNRHAPAMDARPVAKAPVAPVGAGGAQVPTAAPAASLTDAVNPFKNVAPLGAENPRGYEAVKSLVAPVRNWVNKNAPPLGTELPRGVQSLVDLVEPAPTLAGIPAPAAPSLSFASPSGPYTGTPVPIVEPVPVKPEVAPVYQP